MQEEQPNFKVTDRRLFNADGSPRDLPPEEKQETPAPVTQEAAAAAPQPSMRFAFEYHELDEKSEKQSANPQGHWRIV